MHEYLSITADISERCQWVKHKYAIKCRKQLGIINCTQLRESANPIFSGKRV